MGCGELGATLGASSLQGFSALGAKFIRCLVWGSAFAQNGIAALHPLSYGVRIFLKGRADILGKLIENGCMLVFYKACNALGEGEHSKAKAKGKAGQTEKDEAEKVVVKIAEIGVCDDGKGNAANQKSKADATKDYFFGVLIFHKIPPLIFMILS